MHKRLPMQLGIPGDSMQQHDLGCNIKLRTQRVSSFCKLNHCTSPQWESTTPNLQIEVAATAHIAQLQAAPT